MQKIFHIRENGTPGAKPARGVRDLSADQPSAIELDVPPRGVQANLHRDWARSLVLFAACSALLIWIFRFEIVAAIDVWNDSRTFGHAYFIFPITLFLFYRLRHRLVALQPRAAPWGLAPVVGGVLLWVVGDLANVMVMKQFAFVALWQSMFLLVLGQQVARAAIFPLAYLYLAVPFGLSITPTLQDATAQIVVHLLRLSGVPVFLEGFHIEIPNGSFLVADACSGVRYLMVCFALGILAADLFFHSWPRRILFVAVSLVVPIIANGIRAYGIVMLAHLGYDHLAFRVDHVTYGFVFLSIVTMLSLGFGALLRDRRHPAMLPAFHQPIAAATAAPRRPMLQASCVAVGVAIILSVHSFVAGAKAPPSSLAAALRAPDVAPPWIVDPAAPVWSPQFHSTDAALHQSYRRSERKVGLHIGYYVYQREGAEAVSDLNAIPRGSEAMLLSTRQRTVPVGGMSVPINELVIVNGNRMFLVWSWYFVNGQNTNSRWLGKLLEMKALASGTDRSAAIVAISAEVSDNLEATAALLASFLQEALGNNGTLFKAQISSATVAVSARASVFDQPGGAIKP